MSPQVKAVLAVSMLAALAACGGKKNAHEGQAEAEESAPAVTLGASDLATAAATTLRSGVALSGPLTAKQTVVLAAPVAEQIAEMYVDEGTPVRQGQPVARFRDEVLRAAAASANADLVSARTNVQLAAAESTRAVALFAEGAIAQRDRDNALLALETARSRFALAQSQATNATDKVETATLRAPFAGVVSARNAQAGDRVDFQKPVMTIVNNSVLQLEASVEARWLPDLAVGRPVQLAVTGMRDSISGRIARINPIADPATRQVRVYVEVPNRRGLVGGLYVSGYAVAREVRDAVAVPRTAIRVEGANAENVIYVVSGGKVARRVVQPGIEDAARGLVQVSGIAAGDTVVVGPVDGLSEGTRVEVGGTAVRR